MSNALIITVVVLSLLISITIIIVFVVKLKKSVATATTSGTTWVASNNSNPTSTSESGTTKKPFAFAAFSDCGDVAKPRGWYDMQNTGNKNDYCRWVGTPPYFACAYPNETNEYIKVDSTQQNNSHNPPWKLNPFITDAGYDNKKRGFYDFDKDGSYSYFCRAVGDQDTPRMACANNNTLANSKDQFSVAFPPEYNDAPYIPYCPSYNKGTTLYAGPGQFLLVDEFLQVKNKDNTVYTAQLDGLTRRLVITGGSTSYPAIGVEFNTDLQARSHLRGTTLIVQPDGNLIIFNDSNGWGVSYPCWGASTLAPNANIAFDPNDHNTKAVLGQDGILTAYDSAGKAWWSSMSGRLRTAK
jgi:hypothetical protein